MLSFPKALYISRRLLVSPVPAIQPDALLEKLTAFIRGQLAAAGRERLVVGLSGGLDSATASYLAARAVGSENLIALLLPYKTSSPRSIEDALLIARNLGIRHELHEITPIVDHYFAEVHDAGIKRIGNFCVRTRMMILYDLSEPNEALVLGTGNLTEFLLGYTTLWGDMACAFKPLGALYKTQVRQLAAYLEVPAKIIDKPPSADLWSGQTDEGEMGFSYDMVDELLYDMLDLELGDSELRETGFSQPFIDKVRRMIAAAAFKRRLPPTP
jgi:NAD+ synthase